MKFGAQTEYGKLRKVLMHRPGEDLARVTSGNKDAFLFRDVVYWKEFQREHARATSSGSLGASSVSAGAVPTV